MKGLTTLLVACRKCAELEQSQLLVISVKASCGALERSTHHAASPRPRLLQQRRQFADEQETEHVHGASDCGPAARPSFLFIVGRQRVTCFSSDFLYPGDTNHETTEKKEPPKLPENAEPQGKPHHQLSIDDLKPNACWYIRSSPPLISSVVCRPFRLNVRTADALPSLPRAANVSTSSPRIKLRVAVFLLNLDTKPLGAD
ncbi:Hypothetical protein SMAX5B_022107 [Scophthalmus maximus]|uniref:Uncharacterized protein n=1 Tax=Scophthalmus maximus TaxID=52904 RepID=A0A2U9BVC8_SCOMX|nr:Hypothetical protein SMAX5B_022107 [Scophthalmus maximus]